MSLAHKELKYPNIKIYVMSDIYFKKFICWTLFFCMEYSHVSMKQYLQGPLNLVM